MNQATIWNAGERSVPAFTINFSAEEEFLVTEQGQVEFFLTSFTYTTGANALKIYVNGVRQLSGIHFTETSSSSFTLNSGVDVGDTVLAEAYSILGNPASVPTVLYRSTRIVSDGVFTSIPLLSNPGNAASCDFTASGVSQVPEVDFNVTPNSITFSSPYPVGVVLCVRYGSAAPITDVISFTEVVVTPPAGTVFTINLSSGTIFRLNTTGNCIVNLPPPLVGKSYVVEIAYGGTHTVTFTGGGIIRSPGNVIPASTSLLGKIDRYRLYCDGTNTFISDLGRNF